MSGSNGCPPWAMGYDNKGFPHGLWMITAVALHGQWAMIKSVIHHVQLVIIARVCLHCMS